MICKHNNHPLPEMVDMNDAYVKQIQTNNMYEGIPNAIRNEFESTSQRGIKTEFILPRGRRVVVYIAVPAKSKDRPTDFMEYLNRILMWLHFIDEFASPKCTQTLNIYMLLTDAKKIMPKYDYDAVDIVHANTAFTTSCSINSNIFIFRREEWFKVFIHETFHCFGFDFSSSDRDISNKRILSIFPALSPDTDVRLYETSCEMWAELVHMMFCLFYKPCSHTTNHTHICNHKCVPFSAHAFSRILERERIFSIYQSNKLLHRAGYQYADLFAVPTRDNQHYTENTYVFSYYVIKSLMLWNLDKFMDWCVKYSNVNGYPPMQFNNTHIADYCDLVLELTRNDEDYRKMTKMAKRKNKSRANRRLPENTLRMTSIDINTE